MSWDSSREPLARLVEAKWLRDDPPGSLLRNLPQIAIAFAAIGRSAAFPLVPNHQSEKPREDDRSSNRNQDRVNGPTLTLKSDRTHDPAADNRARDIDTICLGVYGPLPQNSPRSPLLFSAHPC